METLLDSPMQERHLSLGFYSIQRQSRRRHIRTTCPCVYIPLHPLLYIKTGVYMGTHYFLIFAIKHRLFGLLRTASVRRFLRVPTINVLSKNKKKNNKFSSEKYQFYGREKLLFIAWSCFPMITITRPCYILRFSHGCKNDYALRERLRTHKVFKKRPVFYLNYHKFSIKSYVLDVY